MDRTVTKLPTHELVYQRIREMVLFGELAPGQAVTILGLIDRLGAGMTPVREAIRRLTAEGALEARGNRRIQVPMLDLAQLDQLAFARLAIEPHLASLAANNLKDNDIIEIAAIDTELNGAIARGDVRAYLRENFRFHQSLYQRAQAPLLLNILSTLWLRFGPSLRVVCGRLGTMNLPDRHAEALAAMRAQDPDAVARAIREDVTQGIELIRNSLQNSEI